MFLLKHLHSNFNKKKFQKFQQEKISKKYKRKTIGKSKERIKPVLYPITIYFSQKKKKKSPKRRESTDKPARYFAADLNENLSGWKRVTKSKPGFHRNKINRGLTSTFLTVTSSRFGISDQQPMQFPPREIEFSRASVHFPPPLYARINNTSRDTLSIALCHP